MLPLVAAALLFYFALQGAPLLAFLLLGAGFLLSVGLALRLANTLQSGTGGHAEWVRDVTVRAYAIRSPGWALAWLVVLAGAAAGFLAD
ncbi:MAG: hypothetical protein VCC00_03920 [Deltaproteobacteria bacterium]